jgi:glycosyltransferase involved in cell wall biosynthesis
MTLEVYHGYKYRTWCFALPRDIIRIIMKLFFDARFIRTDFHDSMSRCSTELATAIATTTPVTFLIHDDAQLKMLPKSADYIKIHAPTSIKEPLTALLLNKYKPDVVFTPMQTMGSLGRKFKLILTLHDLIYYRYRTPPKQFSPLIRLGWRLYHATYIPQRITLNNADAVATVSEASKKEILDAKLTKRPVFVMPNAPRDLAQYLKKPVEVKASPKNLVYMGTFMGYKNVEALIAGMEFLPDRTLHLLSPIEPTRKQELAKRIPKNANVIFHGGVSDKKYAELLADNAVLVSATRYEGFCLPLAEALALGVPAIVSDLPVLHEVGGGGALYFGCNQPQEFAERVKELDKASAIQKITKTGKEHISNFTWEKSAAILLKTAKALTKN